MAILTANGITFAVGNELNSRRQIFDIGTDWVFYQASAPTYWTKSDTNNNKALRVVSGNGGVTGGTSAFTTVMSNFNVGGAFSVSGSVGGTSITLTQTPVHSHGNGGSIALNAVPALFNPDGAFVGWNGGDVNRAGGWTRTAPDTGDTGSPTGVRGAAHPHPFSASATLSNQPVSIAVQYIDVIICSFNG